MKKVIIVVVIFLLGFFAVKHFAEFSTSLSAVISPLLQKGQPSQKQVVVYQESLITDVVERSLPSVVTVGIKKTSQSTQLQFNPFDPFNPFQQKKTGDPQTVQQNIGSGFVVSKDGLIITNKHVVVDSSASYEVLVDGGEKYEVQKIYRDPLNDLAILKIDAKSLEPLPLGDSDKLKLGQLAIAIGTPLGEFQNTVTVGIVSGLGRGITAGSPFEGFVEKLDNVIQTDAAINPGNSGGPLLNSSGQAIGINTAISGEGQNIGFAIPINVVKDVLDTFQKQGSTFERPYIGVRYQMVDKRSALLNDAVEGAYVEEVVKDSPAAKASIQNDDIITEIDGKKLDGSDDNSLAKIILTKKIGQTVTLKVWRSTDDFLTFKVTLEGSEE
ncbi:trypsin-like peptidase domain-containing protein [Candidatus Woesebacteria bacterium]|nr:trypsin-like peptidase domain-containing protein [Candidatus Woesebacteria bacterium]